MGKISTGVATTLKFIVRPGFSKKYSNPLLDANDIYKNIVKQKDDYQKQNDKILNENALMDASLKFASSKEVFDAWVKRKGVTKAQLLVNKKWCDRLSSFYYVLSLILFCYAFGSYCGLFSPFVFFELKLFGMASVFQKIAPMLAAVIFLVRGIRFRHESWMIENSQVVPISLWIKSIKNLMPSGFFGE